MDYTYYDVNLYRNQTYLYFILANCAVPVIAGRKPSCVMTIWKHRIPDINLKEYMEQKGSVLARGCRFEILLETSLYVLLFCYREEQLEKELMKAKESALVSDYPFAAGIDGCICRLEEKMDFTHRRGGEFPHEIGLFLGYPLWDVEGFIRNHGEQYKFVGYWKVYEDVPGAILKFQEYDQLKTMARCLFFQHIEKNHHKK